MEASLNKVDAELIEILDSTNYAFIYFILEHTPYCSV